MLARGTELTDEVVLAAFGADPATIQWLSFDEADDDPAAPRVRFGRRNNWFHAIEHFTVAGTSDDVLRRISGDHAVRRWHAQRSRRGRPGSPCRTDDQSRHDGSGPGASGAGSAPAGTDH